MTILQTKRDDLSRDQRRELYAPENYCIERDSPQEFRAVNVPTGAEFTIWLTGDGMNVRSNTNGTHYVDHLGLCQCGDAEHRTLREARLCKHEAVAAAVEEFVRLEGATERHAERVARICREFEEIFG